MSNNEQTINIQRPASTLPVEVPTAVRMALDNDRAKTGAPDTQKYPSEAIGLPSEGYFYPEGTALSRGTIDIKYMTAKEEDILISPNLIKKGLALEKLLESLIVTPGVRLEDILVGDKNAIFIAARRLAYGDQYGPVEITCRKCGETNKKTIDLSVVKNKEFDFSKYTRGQNLFEFTLPISKKNITYKLLTHRDEKQIEVEIESRKKLSTGTSPEVTTRLKHMIVSIDGNEDRQMIAKFVDGNEMTSRDSLAFRTYVRDNSPNVNTDFTFSCDSCSNTEEVDIPIGMSFFWPNIRV